MRPLGGGYLGCKESYYFKRFGTSPFILLMEWGVVELASATNKLNANDVAIVNEIKVCITIIFIPLF